RIDISLPLCIGDFTGRGIVTNALCCLAANYDCFDNHALEVAEAAAGSSLDGGNMALAIFILVLLLSVLLGGAYVYVTRCRYHSNLRLPLMYPHPYSQITVETEFDNPLYETGGDTREYEPMPLHLTLTSLMNLPAMHMTAAATAELMEPGSEKRKRCDGMWRKEERPCTALLKRV
ncbi:hypothetical protein GJAV_G00042110, partial [Gymnothorax javanicus]